MTKTEKATQYMEAIARDDSHGYSQYHRNGDPDFDCSSLTIRAWREAGLKLSGASYTENMDAPMLAEGFQNVTSKVNIATGAGLKRGDVLRRKGHVGMYCGNMKQVEACCDEFGGIVGANKGDQHGWEIAINPYSGNWSAVFRYMQDEPERNYLQKGDSGEEVVIMKRMLISLGYTCGVDGATDKFNVATEKAVKNYQKASGLTVDGLYGKATKSKLTADYKKKVLNKWKATGTATCKNSNIYFRATASSANKANLLGKVGKGQRFEVDGKKSGRWVHAKHAEFGVGYITQSYVVYDKQEQDSQKTDGWKAVNTAICTDDDVNVRSSARSDISTNIIGKLNKGQRFEVDGTIKNDWVHVKVAGYGIGWIYKTYVKYDN